MERWNGGTVERWNGGTVERRRPSHGAQFKSKSLVFVSLFFFLWLLFLRVFARFCALSFPMSSNRIRRESAWNKSRQQTRENARKPANAFLGVDPRPSASSALIRGSSYVFQASSGRVSWEQFGTRIHADLRGWPRIKRMI